jgi:SAP domain
MKKAPKDMTTREFLQSQTVKELRALLKAESLKVSGTKKDLCDRLMKAANKAAREDVPRNILSDNPMYQPNAPELPTTELLVNPKLDYNALELDPPFDLTCETCGGVIPYESPHLYSCEACSSAPEVKPGGGKNTKIPTVPDPSKNRTIPFIPETLPTITAMYKTHRRTKNDPEKRGVTISAGGLGLECKRRIWYRWRWAREASFPDRILRIFERGDLEEPRFIKELKASGVQVWSTRAEEIGAPWTVRVFMQGTPSESWHVFDPYGEPISSHGLDASGAHNACDKWNAKQIKVTALCGHIGARLDGVGLGLLEAPKTPHVLEYKTAKASVFRAIVKRGVEVEKPEHFVQCQIYMLKKGLKRTLYLVTNKDDEDIHGERIRFDKVKAEAAIAKALEVIKSEGPPDRIGRDATFWKCKLCDMSDVCHKTDVPDVNCRTCLHSTPVLDDDEGKEFPEWVCEYGGGAHKLDKSRQVVGCPKHLFIPGLLSPEFEFVGSNEPPNAPTFIEYRGRTGERLLNVIDDPTELARLVSDFGPAVLTSAEIRGASPPISISTDFATLRRELSEVPF